MTSPDPHAFDGGGNIILAEQLVEVPPPLPTHCQPHVVVPVLTGEVAAPEVHRPVVGATLNIPPLDGPQTPLITGGVPAGRQDMVAGF